MDEDDAKGEDQRQRETITVYVTGNGSDSAAVQEVLNELAFMDDEIILKAQQAIEGLLDTMDEESGDEGFDEDGEVDELEREITEDDELYEALEKIAELLSEIRLYNKAQKLDPIESTFLSKQLGI